MQCKIGREEPKSKGTLWVCVILVVKGSGSDFTSWPSIPNQNRTRVAWIDALCSVWLSRRGGCSITYIVHGDEGCHLEASDGAFNRFVLLW